jgi:hypothetical protein
MVWNTRIIILLAAIASWSNPCARAGDAPPVGEIADVITAARNQVLSMAYSIERLVPTDNVPRLVGDETFAFKGDKRYVSYITPLGPDTGSNTPEMGAIPLVRVTWPEYAFSWRVPRRELIL